MADTPTLNIGICGLGTVGQGVWKHVQRQKVLLEARSGCRLVLHRAAVRDLKKARTVKIDAKRLTDDALAVATDPTVDIVCELMGGTKLARKVVLAALERGKTVVTANKALLCDHGDEVFAAAVKHGGRVFYEASVCGGIPVLKALREGLVANRFKLIYGILNGTCNYILTRMERERKGFEEILGDARQLGYVEADESLDIDGWDTAHKASVLAYLAHGRWIKPTEMAVEGIRHVSLQDIETARELGYKVKLTAVIRRDLKSDRVSVRVHPSLVPLRLALANVDEVYNGVSVTGDVVGETVYIGRGAGQDPTASAVISDIVDAALAIRNQSPQLVPGACGEVPELATDAEIEGAYYLRLTVADKPGVLAEIAATLAREEISIESVLQKPAPEAKAASLVLVTHRTNEQRINRALAALKASGAVRRPPLHLRLAPFV